VKEVAYFEWSIGTPLSLIGVRMHLVKIQLSIRFATSCHQARVSVIVSFNKNNKMFDFEKAENELLI
jgi:hypothetical protein